MAPFFSVREAAFYQILFYSTFVSSLLYKIAIKFKFLCICWYFLNFAFKT